MPRRMVVEASVRACLSITARPHAYVHCINRSSIRIGIVSQWVTRKQSSEMFGIYPTMTECGVETAPTASMLRLQAQVNRRGLRTTGYEGIIKLKQSIGAFGKARIQTSSKGVQGLHS
jgi:hypothetical protein